MQILFDPWLELENAHQHSPLLPWTPPLCHHHQHHPPTSFLAINLLQTRQIWVTNMNARLLCIVKIKVTCWQLRDNHWKDEWPCPLVKVGRRCSSMNGSWSSEYSLISELWVETDSPNYRSSSNEWPWEAAEMSVVCTHAHMHTHQRTYFVSENHTRCFFPTAALCSRDSHL